MTLRIEFLFGDQPLVSHRLKATKPTKPLASDTVARMATAPFTVALTAGT